MNYLDLFSGCGGWALGMEKAGFIPKLLIDSDRHCTNTLAANRPGWNIFTANIEDYDFGKCRNKVDVVTAGLPCQPYSNAGLGKGLEDARGQVFFSFLKCLETVQPKIVVIENVKGLTSKKHAPTLQLLLESLRDVGYVCKYKVLNSQFYKVPQKRERLFVVGIRQDLQMPWIFPQPSFQLVTLKEALQNCPISEGAKYSQAKAEILKLVPPGGNWRSLPDDIQKVYKTNNGGGNCGVAKRLSWEEVCPTLTCHPAQKTTERCHPQETRPLTIREYARIQTFPDSWQFTGSITSQYKQIGNAVPVNLAHALGKSLRRMLNLGVKMK